MIREIFKSKMEEANKKIEISGHLKWIWDKINGSLKSVGLRFTNFKQF